MTRFMKKPVLKYNINTGEGSVVVPDDWFSDNSLLRADILQDWIGDLTKEYNKARQQMATEHGQKETQTIQIQ